MNADLAPIAANLRTLRAARDAALRAMNLASQDGTAAEWLAAHKAAKAPCEAVDAEERRIRATGFYSDLDLEYLTLGRLGRRHE